MSKESQEVISVLRSLVAIDTTSSNATVEIAEYISNYLSEYGFDIEHHKYAINGTDKINVIAQKGDGDNMRLALTGHMDTVPFNPAEWRTNPLELTKVGNKWYGRGTCDMQGFIALAMVAGSQISTNEVVYPFGLIFTSDEEVGCVGARKLVKDKGKVADMCIIGEPTDLYPFNLHKGYMYLKIELQGKNGHSSRPAEAISVVDALGVVLSRIEMFKSYLEDIEDLRLYPSYPTLNVGVISTGTNAAKNIVPDYCRIELDIRPVPNQDVSELFSAFSHFVTGGKSNINGVKVKIKYGRTPTPPMHTSSNSIIVKEVEDVCGHKACSTAFNTEGGVFNSVGMGSVIYGLGSIQQAHQPNEYLHEKYLTEDVIRQYMNIIKRLCGREA